MHSFQGLTVRGPRDEFLHKFSISDGNVSALNDNDDDLTKK